MKRLILYLSVVGFLASCSNSGNGELVGTRKKSKPFYQPDPYGMVFIPQGSYTMGAADEDITNSYLVQPKTCHWVQYGWPEISVSFQCVLRSNLIGNKINEKVDRNKKYSIFAPHSAK